MKKETDSVEVCPNCGHRVQEKDRMPNLDKLYKDISGLEYGASGRILCPNCNFSGLPAKIHEHDLADFKFPNKEIRTRDTKVNPNYMNLMFVLLLVPLLFIIGLLVVTQYYPLTLSPLYFLVLILVYLLVWVYVFLKVPIKYKD
jgi:DNA-directed RNA polymerase subunit RPC12/RpoP